MSRPVDPLAQYTVKPHLTNGHTYASTQPPIIDPDTGKKIYRHVHWGTVEGNSKFFPGRQYWSASPEERAKLIFPEIWDMSEVDKLTDNQKQCIMSCDNECQNRFYGDIWLLEQIASKTGIRQDLEVVFNENKEFVDDLLTLAMFPYITMFTFNRLARWQRIVKAPSSRELTSTMITRLCQSITEQDRMNLIALRSSRLDKNEFCAIDSTSRSAYGNSLADIHWGKNKEQLPLEQTLEVVLYTLTSHMPVYYRTFPGNMPDSRSLEVILTDLEHAGFKNQILVTDRGYETLRTLEKFILTGQSMIMCAKTTQKEVLKVIQELEQFSNRPEEMEVDPDAKLYYKQYDINYEITTPSSNNKTSNLLKINLYFDPLRRSREMLELDIDITSQKNALTELLNNKTVIEDDAAIGRDYSYFKVICDPISRVIKSFTLKEKKILKARSLSGFFSIISHGVDLDAITTLNTYRIRDEQEKYFEQMKSQMVSDRQRNWSEEGKTGRLFILFISLILGSYVRFVWKSTSLHKKFTSSLEILDEMRPIRCIEHANLPKKITPFIGAQVDICDAFGFEIPDGCAPTYKSQQKHSGKRGRPPKRSVEQDL
jgi:transposase